MSEYDWSRFVTRININAPADKIYRCWATREGIESWFLKMSEYAKPGGNLRADHEMIEKADTYRWSWYGYEIIESGDILEANGKDLFKFSFGEAGICTVSVKKEEGENIVELIQENIPTTEQGMHSFHLGCKTGWTFFLANLKSLLEGGIDLRNKNEKLTRMINA